MAVEKGTNSKKRYSKNSERERALKKALESDKTKPSVARESRKANPAQVQRVLASKEAKEKQTKPKKVPGRVTKKRARIVGRALIDQLDGGKTNERLQKKARNIEKRHYKAVEQGAKVASKRLTRRLNLPEGENMPVRKERAKPSVSKKDNKDYINSGRQAERRVKKLRKKVERRGYM